MAFFVKIYDNKESSIFHGSIVENDAQHFHFVGGIGDDALFSQTDLNGTPVLTYRYRIQGQKILLRTGVQADNGDLLLYGSMRSSNANRNKNLVIRTNNRGDVLWAKTYTQAKTRFNIHLVKSVNDTYFMSSWLNVSGTTDDVEIIKIGGDGTVLQAVNIVAGSDDQINKIIPMGSGVLVFGGTSAGPGWDNFMVALDANLNVVWKKLIGASTFQEIRDVEIIDSTHFVLTGETGGQRDSFMLNFDINQSSHVASTYDFVGGQEGGIKQLVQTANGFYLCGLASASKTSFLARFDHSLNLQWLKGLSLDDTVIFRDLINVGGANDELLLAGNVAQAGNLNLPLVAYTDDQFNSCSTVILPTPVKKEEVFKSSNWNTVVPKTEIAVQSYEVIRQVVSPTELKICPSDNLDLGGNNLFQSPYIYLQAAGSDESDDSVKGFHLRWDLLRKLGETHLPKGDYSTLPGAYQTSIAYNRADDYVRIYKTEFKKDYGVEIDLSNAPDSLVESGATREWIYQNLIPINTLPTQLTDVRVNFQDTAQYDALRTSIDPATDSIDLIKNYTGIIDVRTVGKFKFSVSFTIGVQNQNQEGGIRLETISLGDTLDNTTRTISCRETLTPQKNDPVHCENIEFIRFDYVNAYPQKIRLCTYDDFILGTNSKGDWNLLGQFSLDDGNTDASQNVFKRLEDSAAYTVHNKWRKYNEPDVNAAGEFRVNVNNYQDKWTMVDGLKQAVETYLTASVTDVTATVTHTNSDPIVNDSEMDISYLDMLNFVALDFHVARMLGLGHIDHDASVSSNKEFIYLMHYVTEAQLENESPVLTMQHFYMTPPLSIVDYKLPQVPIQEELTYGIYVNNHTGSPSLITNAAGYNPYGPSRYIQINRGQFNFERPLENFYQSGIEYCLCHETIPVLLGLEYADDTIAVGNPFKRPEITHDLNYLDPGGLPEVTAIPLTDDGMVYIHEETNEGIHHYGLYSINWFSRVSPVGNKKETDFTEFPKLNTLLPPSNLAVQLIQKEVPLIFTTGQEQQDLTLITDADKTYVRITFDWNEIHNKAYQTADGVELFWRQNEPSIIQGEIQTGSGAVIEDPLTHTVLVQTTGYYNASVNQSVTPQVTPGQEALYEGARLTAGAQSYLIEEVVTSGVNPSFRLRQIRQTASQDVNNDNIFCTTETWISPVQGERFLVSENLENSASWDEQLAATVSLEQFSNHTETVSYDDGTTKTFTIGGLTGSAVIADIPDPDPNIVANHVPPGGPTQVPTGVYTITYDSELLPPHPNGDPNAIVNYIRGTVRLLDVNNELKTLNVWKIEELAGVTVLTAFDPTFGLERDANDDFVLTSSQFTPLPGYAPIQTGSVPFVNYHPSYQVYVYHGTGGSTFVDTNILPAVGEGTRNTFMAVRSVDSTITPTPCKSFMSPPTVLMAREISEPVPPGVPDGPLFATRPNFYGKATYTFDVKVENPFSLIFYRANERKILDQLYKPATADQIIEDLANLTSPDLDFYQNRWYDLVNMIVDTGTDTFKEYTAGGYRFPMPNNDLYKIPHADPSVQELPFTSAFIFSDNYSYTDPSLGTVNVSMFELVKDCIDGAFLPLTEIPAVYKQLQESEFETSGKKPVLRNPQTGARYTTDDAEYDPWPMAFRFEKNGAGDALQSGDAGYGAGGNLKFVRFTDYTLDGAAKNFYFYFAVELSNTLAVSDRSPVAGPIQLVNSAPAVAPEIKKTVTQLSNLQLRLRTAVRFELNDFVASENIKQFQIYRSIKPENALSVRTMELAKTISVGEDVTDNFSDKLFPLYGEPLFYRIVALREIQNEQGVLEMVPSLASNLVLTNVVDNMNPVAPPLIITHDPAVGAPLQIANVSIAFSQVTYNAVYRLYKQNSKGNWEIIHEISSTEHLNLPTVTIDLADTSLGSNILEKQTASLNPIYHRFRVDVENSSGLINLKKGDYTV